ncbi:Glutamyl-tRNA(Gln) amidotransferase subunit A [Linum perenne]
MALDVCHPSPTGLTRLLLLCLTIRTFSCFPLSNSASLCSSAAARISYPSTSLRLLLLLRQDSDELTGKCSNSKASQLREAFKIFDAGFFTEAKTNKRLLQVLKVAQEAVELNLPIAESNRKLVASVNGGLENPSCLVFNSDWAPGNGAGVKNFNHPSVSGVNKRPENDEVIAFMNILELGELLQTKQITSEQLTTIFLKRLKRYNRAIESVITFTEDLAYEQAKKADDLLAKGDYLGPLHGIPYGLKDIIAVPGYKTTWGSTSFKNQVLDMEATVYQRLKAAGAVLVAKLVSGSLAYDDIWFGGRTRNPWNIEEFSTGSSAGPAASTSAGMIPFAIGSETAGSITYPAARCGDKLGPFCRSAIDCSIVLDVIRGKDSSDISSRDIPLQDPFSVDITKLTVGYLDDAEMEVVDVLKSKGVNMVPFNLNYTVDNVQGILNFTMDVEMLAHFDQWQREGLDDVYEAQDQWPTELRRARAISAVDYIHSQRARGKLIGEVKESFTVDAFIGNVTDWEKVCMGNLVGLPVIVVPTGFKNIPDPPSTGSKRRTTITTGIYAPPGHDHIVLALAMAYQSVTDHHKQQPPIDNLGEDDIIPSPPKHIIPPRVLRL